MDKDIEFVIPVGKVRILRDKLSHIGSLFKEVQVKPVEVDRNDQWVRVSSSNNDSEELRKVKEYINALCDSAGTTKITLEIDEYPAFMNQENMFNLEKMFGVVSTLGDNAHKVNIKGSEMNVVLAESWIAENHASLPKAEKLPDMIVPDGSIHPSLKEFALKLGYTEQDVNSVAKKFGPDVDQNQLLRELIQLKGTSTSRSFSKGIDNPSRGNAGVRGGQIVARGATPKRAAETQIRDAIRGTESAPTARGVFPSSSENSQDSLLPIVIDGSNVAMSHGNQRVFSCRGIELCVTWFKERGHREIYALVPKWRTETPRMDYPITHQYILQKLADQNFVKFTPSRRVAGRNIVCYDDRFIVDLAYKLGGVVVSNDNYRDLMRENSEWKDVIENRLLMYSFAGDYFMPPHDPLGKYGPSLKEFLQKGTKSHPRVCPHISRCTYGSKCRYYHPERDPKRRQELLSGGKPRQVGRSSSTPSYDTRNPLAKDATLAYAETSTQLEQPWQYQHYTYSPAYHTYNNSSCASNEESIQDQHYDAVYAQMLQLFGEDKETFARAEQKLRTVYSPEKDVETIINNLCDNNL